MVFLPWVFYIYGKKGKEMKKIRTYIGRHWLGYIFAIACMIIAIVLDMICLSPNKCILDCVTEIVLPVTRKLHG